MKKEKEVRVFEVKYYCDKCGKEVKFTGLSNLVSPSKYQHCCECGEKYWLNEIYPVIKYKEVN